MVLELYYRVCLEWKFRINPTILGPFKNQYWVEYNIVISRTYREDDLFYANEFSSEEELIIRTVLL